MKPKKHPPSEEEIVFQYKKHFLSLGNRDGFYEWLCEEFCEKEPWDCDNCPYREKILEKF